MVVVDQIEGQAGLKPGMNQKIRVFTSSAVNYIPKVRLLCQSLKHYHPEWKVHWAVADRIPASLNIDSDLIDQTIPVESLGIPDQEGWIFKHTLVELSTGIKPFVVRHLLDDPETTAVLYFDPDMVLFSRLDDLIGEFDRHSILLTPHQTKPETNLDAVIDNEICSLRYGIFNLGFLGIRNDKNGRAFTNWWADRVYHFCQESLEQHLFTDQKWVNFAPVFFDGVGILKSSRFNVATWNITTRDMTGSFSDGFRVDGAPLGFYHFTGFDSGAHKTMAMKNGGDNRAVKSLVQWYEKQQQRCIEDATSLRWAFSTFTNGEPVTAAHRFIFRSRRDLQKSYPHPFETDQQSNVSTGGAQSFYDWFSWRAGIEYPQLLTASEDAMNTAIAMNQDTRLAFGWGRIRKHLWLSFKSRDYAWWTIKRIWHLWRAEGIINLIGRVCRYPGRPI